MGSGTAGTPMRAAATPSSSAGSAAGADLAEWGRPITDAVAALLGSRPVGFREPGPMLVSPGSIGQWQGAR